MSAEHASPRSASSAVAVPARPEPRRARPGRHLRPVEGPARRRRSPAVPVLVGTGMVLLSLFALAVMHALLIGGQIQLDQTQREVAAEAEEVRQLRLRVAQLESPDRVLDVARQRLGMVPPAEVGYLLPASVDIEEDAPVRVAAAERPAADEDPAVGTVSPDRSPSGAGDTVDGDDADDVDSTGDARTDAARTEAAPTEADGGSEGGPEEDIG